MKLELELTTGQERLINALVATGLYGNEPTDAVDCLVNEGLRRRMLVTKDGLENPDSLHISPFPQDRIKVVMM